MLPLFSIKKVSIVQEDLCCWDEQLVFSGCLSCFRLWLVETVRNFGFLSSSHSENGQIIFTEKPWFALPSDERNRVAAAVDLQDASEWFGIQGYLKIRLVLIVICELFESPTSCMCLPGNYKRTSHSVSVLHLHQEP